MKTNKYFYVQLLVAMLIISTLGFNFLTGCKEDRTKAVGSNTLLNLGRNKYDFIWLILLI